MDGSGCCTSFSILNCDGGYPVFSIGIKLSVGSDLVILRRICLIDGWSRPEIQLWIDGNAYFEGAKCWKNEKNSFADASGKVHLDLVERDGNYYLDTNIYEVLKGFEVDMISTDTLGEALEPSQKFENPDGTPITFDLDFFGNRRGLNVIPGPLSSGGSACKQLLR